jgi:hypothetical protein
MSVPAADGPGVPQQDRDAAVEESRPDEAGAAEDRSDVSPAARPPRRPGSERGLIIHMADDFDATPEELLDYF